MSAFTASSPFSRAVVSSMRKLYPEALAEKSWDNTGLLLEAPFYPQRRKPNSVLLTVDLTRAVADEAIERNDSIIVAYHPIIFRGLKSMTLADSQQESLLRLAAEGISVYSPHTAIDAAPGGLGDWLADIVTGTPMTAPLDGEQTEMDGAQSEGESKNDSKAMNGTAEGDPFLAPKRPVYMLQHHPSQRGIKDKDLKLAAKDHTRSVIRPTDAAGIPNAGVGRLVRFTSPHPLPDIIERIACGLGNPKGFPIAIPQGRAIADISVSSIGICAGAGASVLGGLDDVDLLFTGEMGHHEALAAIEKGQCVITLFHSNTERGFLHSVLARQLMEVLPGEWERVRREEGAREEVEEEEGLREMLEDGEVSVEVSEADRDPYGIVISKAET